jgi:hypothetical protein
VRTLESMRRIGWDGDYIAWGHFQAEEELERLKDGRFYVIGTNAFLEDNLPMRRINERIGGKPYKLYRIYEKAIG